MTYETDLLDQAEREKCSQSTFFERKSMSTKTAFKRVVLVAAAALAIGGISAVSAQAVNPPDLAVVNGTGATTGGALPTYTAAVTQIAGPANFITLTPAIPTGSDYITVTGGTFVGGATTAVVSTVAAVNVATPTVGTVTVNAYEITAGVASTTAQTTVTISVVTALPGTVYGASTVYAASGVTSPTSVTDAAFSVTSPSGTASVANFQVTENDAAAVALTSGFKGITVAAANGLLTSTGGIVTPSATTYIAGTPTASGTNFVLSGISGYTGATTVTISVNGVVAKTYSVIFTGAAVKIVATVLSPVIGVTGAAATVTANTNAVKVQEFDAAGNAIAVTGGLTITPASTTVGLTKTAQSTQGSFWDGSSISATANGISLAGTAAGTTTFTVADGTLVSAPVSVCVSSALPTAVVMTTDAATYGAGAAGKLVATLSDAAGTVPAGTYAVLSGAATSSYALTTGTLPSGSITVKTDGTATVAFNAPLSDGSVEISATGVTGVTVTPAVFTVASASSDAANAATDAANEATDAANAATDAANAAADSADAATQAAMDAGDKADAALAAVTALSQQVTTLLAKVAALASTLAKISAAVAKLPKK
jgi:hypothetical protein